MTICSSFVNNLGYVNIYVWIKAHQKSKMFWRDFSTHFNNNVFFYKCEIDLFLALLLETLTYINSIMRCLVDIMCYVHTTGESHGGCQTMWSTPQEMGWEESRGTKTIIKIMRSWGRPRLLPEDNVTRAVVWEWENMLYLCRIKSNSLSNVLLSECVKGSSHRGARKGRSGRN